MTSTEQYVTTARQMTTMTEQSVNWWKQGAEALTEQADRMSRLMTIDPTAGVQRYFEVVQRSIDFNRDLAGKWANAVNSVSGTFGAQMTAVTGVTRDQIDAVADVVTDEVQIVEAAVEHQADLAEAEVKAEARRVRAAERAAEKEAQEKAREPYQGLTKTELSDQLVERELPKSGNLDELVDRLVESDAARAPYVGLTKAELSDQLADRELPKSGTVDELIGRLVEADQSAEADAK